jgi:hypothetical protein
MLGSHLLFAIDKQLYMVITSGVDKSACPDKGTSTSR